MADQIQLDGKTYMPIMDAAALTRVPEAQVRAVAQEGKVFLRAIGKKVYVDIAGLKKVLESGTTPATVPVVTRNAPIPVPPVAPQRAAPAMTAAPTAPSPATLTAKPVTAVSQMKAVVAAQPRPVEKPAVDPVPSPLPPIAPQVPLKAAVPATRPHSSAELAAMTVAPREFTKSLKRPSSIPVPVAAAVAAMLFISILISGRYVLVESPVFAEYSQKAMHAAASIFGWGTPQQSSATASVQSGVAGPSENQAAAHAQTFIAGTNATTTPPIYYVYNYPIIERVTEEVRYIPADAPDFQAQIDALYQKIQNQIQSLSVNTGTQFAQQYQVIAQTNNIDKLGSVTIENSTITGGTITGATITGGSVTATAFSGTLGVSNGGTGISTAPSLGQLLMGNVTGGYDLVATSSLGLTGASASASNTWSALQVFGAGASTTQLSVFQKAYFGGTATSTFDSTGALSLVSNGLTVGTSEFVVASSKVGVGTTSPWARFAVQAKGGQTNPVFEVASSSNATPFLTVTSSGDIGVGTSSPSTRLEVVKTSSGATAEQLYLTNFASATSTASRLSFRAADVTGSATSTGAITAILQQNFNTGKSDLAFSTLQSGTLAEVFRATSGGNVGVGTTTPLRKFAVSNTASAAQVSIAYSDAAVTELQTDSAGDFVINPSGDDVRINDDNLWVCAGGACPSGTPTGNGNLIVETALGVGTSSPATALATAGLVFVGANGATGAGTATSTFYGDIRIIGKLDVSTIDPVYTIDGVKYATYGLSTIGIKEEVATKLSMSRWDSTSGLYKKAISFSELEKGSDLWLFYQVTDFGKKWENLIVSLTPAFNGFAFYEYDPSAKTLTIYASQEGEVSMRLIANRYDFSKWGNLREDQEDRSYLGHEIQEKR